MLRQVAEGVLIHQSEFCQSNAVVVQGRAGPAAPPLPETTCRTRVPAGECRRLSAVLR